MKLTKKEKQILDEMYEMFIEKLAIKLKADISTEKKRDSFIVKLALLKLSK